MKHVRFTNAHQSITFSRRMMLLGGAQAAVGTPDRTAGLAVGCAEPEIPAPFGEQPRPAHPGAASPGLDHRPTRKPLAINKASFRVDIIPQQLVDAPKVVAQLAQLMQPFDEVQRITDELKTSRGFQPVSVSDNVPYEQYAAVTVRLPELPGVSAARGFTRFYPAGSAVGQLVGYVGAASVTEYEKEGKNPLLLVPGVKIGKEGLERTWSRTYEENRAASASRPLHAVS